MLIYLKLIKESFVFSVNSLRTNKLRTFLSLLGITIGIFAIISVFTVIDSLRNSIKDSIQSLGDNIVYVDKWPWEMANPNVPWWKYMNRPYPTLKEASYLEKNLHKAQAVAFSATANKNAVYLSNSLDNISLIGGSSNYNKVRLFDIAEGRDFTKQELQSGKRVAIIGQTVVEHLFEGKSPINKTIKVDNQKTKVIGVFAKEGTDMFNKSMDNAILIPVNFMRIWLDVKQATMRPLIMIKAKNNIPLDELKDETTRLLRKIRKIRPKDENNFALNQTSMLTSGFEKVFGIIDWAGIVIGGFSILVGAFGIANIMFVSVKERTHLIGIQKALGAKNYFILFQFIFESVFLSILGGILGLILVSILVFAANKMVEMQFTLSWINILRGIGISFIVGIVAGFIPSRNAARLNPVKAISSNF